MCLSLTRTLRTQSPRRACIINGNPITCWPNQGFRPRQFKAWRRSDTRSGSDPFRDRRTRWRSPRTGSSAQPMSDRAERWPLGTDLEYQDASRRGAIQRPSSRRAAFKREPSPGMRIGRPSLRGMNTAAARQTPIGSRCGSRNSSRKMLDRLIGIDKPPRAGATVREWSGRRDSNPRPQPWQGCALPLSYTRIREGKAIGFHPGRPESMPKAAKLCNRGQPAHFWNML